MRTFEKLNRYLYEKKYKITIMEDVVDIVGYEEIIDFSISRISVKYENKIRFIGIISAVCWLIYAIIHVSYSAIIFEVLTVIATIAAYVKNKRVKN